MCGRRRPLSHISSVDVGAISKENEIHYFHQLSASTGKPCGSEPRLPHVYRENTMVSDASNPTATTTRKTGGFMRAAARDDTQVALRQSCAWCLFRSIPYVLQLPRFVDSTFSVQRRNIMEYRLDGIEKYILLTEGVSQTVSKCGPPQCAQSHRCQNSLASCCSALVRIPHEGV